MQDTSILFSTQNRQALSHSPARNVCYRKAKRGDIVPLDERESEP